MRALLAAALLLAPALALGGSAACPGEPLAALRAQVQDDAASGGDAPDCRAAAYLLPATQEYSWGFLDPAGASGATDLDDWFAQDLTAAFGTGSYVMVNATAVFPPVYVGLPAQYLLVHHLPYVVDIYPPDAAEPSHRVTSCSEGVWLPPADGVWLFHVHQLTALEAEPCVSSYLPGQPTAPPLLADYGVYRGCKPVCAAG